MRLAPIAALVLFAACFTAACDDATGVLAKGGWAASFTETGETCNTLSHNGMVGQVSTGDASGVSIDGTDGADITCAVYASGGGFTASGSASQNGYSLTISIGEISGDNTADNPANGTASFASPQTITAFTSNMPCKFFFTGEQLVDTGKIWVSFTCDDVENGMQMCAISNGVAAFEDCDTSP
ncbi:MAG TPA: hypothetical protein VGM56_04155 [Byssovorax sp.]|jgi:hypothetical protein